MATSPSFRYDENGTLAERAIASDVAGARTEAQAVTGRPNDPVPENSTFAERAKAGKQVAAEDAENKAVSAKKAAKK